jgi:hypothetical protein
VGYTWTLSGRTLQPYCFPLTARDVHIFDDLIFPPYRGRSLNSIYWAMFLSISKEPSFSGRMLKQPSGILLNGGPWRRQVLVDSDGEGSETPPAEATVGRRQHRTGS